MTDSKKGTNYGKRGGSAYFSFVKDMQSGDTLTYTTKYGTRTYKVPSKTQISEWDNLPLS